MVRIGVLSDKWLVRYTQFESSNGTELQTNEPADERKDENNIPLGINAGVSKHGERF